MDETSMRIPPRLERMARNGTLPPPPHPFPWLRPIVVTGLLTIGTGAFEIIRRERADRALRAGVAALDAATTERARAALLRARVPRGTPVARASDSLAVLGFDCAREERTTRPGATGAALACMRPIRLPQSPILRLWATDSAGVVTALAYVEATTVGATPAAAGRDTVVIRDVPLR
jgi:hypothetical protein